MKQKQNVTTKPASLISLLREGILNILKKLQQSIKKGKYFETVACFKLVFYNKVGNNVRTLSRKEMLGTGIQIIFWKGEVLN